MTFIFTKLNEQFNRLINKVARLPALYLVLSALIADIIISCIFSYILFPDNTSGPDTQTTAFDFLLVVVCAPILETWFCQSWLIKTTLKYTNNNQLLAVLVSAIIFGLGHSYSVAYIMKGTIAGMIYAVLYVSMVTKQKDAFFYVAATHGIYNLIGFIITAFE